MFSRPNGFQAAIQHDKITSTNLHTLAPFLDLRAPAARSQPALMAAASIALEPTPLDLELAFSGGSPRQVTFSGGPPRQTDLLGRSSPSKQL